MNSIINAYDHQFIDLLKKYKINYVSMTAFNRSQAVMSYCNNFEWFDYYKKEYNLDKPPPVQKYILASSLGILSWDSLGLDNEAQNFIKKRNKAVSAKTNISILYKKHQQLVAVTLGSEMNESNLVRLLSCDTGSLFFMINNMFDVVR